MRRNEGALAFGIAWTRRAAGAAMALLLCAAVAFGAVPLRTEPAYADSGHSGISSAEHGLGYTRHWGWNSDDEYSAGYSEKKVGNEYAWCVQDGATAFPSGKRLTGIDPVKAGIYEQELVTDLALAHAYVWEFDLYRTPSGAKLKNDRERYAATGVLLFTILRRAEGARPGAPSQHSMYVDGKNITGNNLESQNNKDAYAWIKANRDNYIGYMQYFKTDSDEQSGGGLFRVEPTFGSIKGKKTSAKASMTDGNANYSLQGAVYGVFETLSKAETHSASKAIGTYKTDANGAWETGKEFKEGTYFVAEITPSKGYELDETVYTVKVSAGDVASVSMKETPKGAGIKLTKKSANTTATNGNDNYSLKGALFGVFSSKSDANSRSASKAIVTAKTNDDGVLETGKVLPAGTYYVTEITASKGYKVNEEVFSVILSPGEVEALSCAEQPQLGALKIVKSSNNKKVSDANGCYTLEGAQYGVFLTKAAAQSHDASQAKWKYATDAKGLIQTGMVFPIGTYYVAETVPSTGYLLDEGVYTAKVEGEKTATVNGADGSKETPAVHPLGIVLQKFDYDTGELSQGSARLDGAEFTISFYNGYHAADALPESATRTWVLKTDELGVIDFQNPIKVSGGDFYTDASGRNVMPLGTVSIVETKAPVGYNLETPEGDPSVYVMQIVEDASADGGASARPLNYEGSGRVEQSNTAVDATDVVMRGDFRIVKECNTDISEDAPQDQKRILVPGIQFQLINDSEHAVLSPEDGSTLVEPGEVVCTMTTDENGLASTDNASANGWPVPAGWTGALAYGTYVVHEVIPDDIQKSHEEAYGAKLVAADDWKVNISAEGQYDPPALVDNKIPQSPLAVVKVDAETGRRIPLEVSFQLYDGAGELVTYTSHYPEEATIDTWTSNARGELTLPMLLPGGTYTLQEVEAPEGYVLAESGVDFTIDDYRTWADPITITFENTPIKGIIELVKTDAQTGDAVPGATYIVEAAEDIVTPEGTVRLERGSVAATLKTDEGGCARTDELYLGSYKVYEAKSPEGFALDTVEHIVTLESEGQHVAVVTHTENLSDKPTTLQLYKVDAETGEPLRGAVFLLWQDSGAAVDDAGALDDAAAADGEPGDDAAEGDVADAAFEGEGDGADGAGQEGDGAQEALPAEGERVNEIELETDEEGKASVGYLAHGTYHLVETRAPAGHYIGEDAARIDFRVDEQGFIGIIGGEYSDTLVITAANRPCEIGTTLSDEGVHSVFAAHDVKLTDTVSYKGATEGKEYLVQGVLHLREVDDEGNVYDAGPALDADGREIRAEAKFTAEGSVGQAQVVFEFNAYALAGKHVVAFEEMYDGPTLFAVHADITDESQTVKIEEPSIGTTLTCSGEHHAKAAGKVTLVDAVAYHGAVLGREYTAKGILHVGVVDANGKVTDGGPALDANGREITAEATFKPSAQDGIVELTFEFDATGLAGRRLVAFESVFDGEHLFATHADITDEGQTVTFEPEAKTTLVDEATGNHTSRPDGKIMLVDTIAFKGLVPGREYRAIGTLVDGWTEKAIKDAKGNPVHAETKFTPDAPDGTVEVVFAFRAKDLAGKSAVAFETIMDGNAVVVTHADPNDEAQTVHFPSAQTIAKDAEDEDKIVEAKDKARIVDTIAYTGLTPGQKYRAEGELHLVKVGERSGKTDGGVLKDAHGSAVSASVEFVPEKANGSVDVTFTFDASKLDGRTLVVFEKVSHITGKGKAIRVATHEDPTDSDQMATVKKNAPKASPKPKHQSGTAPTTGDFLARLIAGIIASLFAACGIAIYAHRRQAAL